MAKVFCFLARSWSAKDIGSIHQAKRAVDGKVSNAKGLTIVIKPTLRRNETIQQRGFIKSV